MKSILQDDESRCWLCGRPANGDPLDWHHVFGGAYRKKSEKYGLKVKLHHNVCHIFGDKAVHQCAERNREMQKKAQIVAMATYGWSEDEFRRMFGRSYLGDT